MEINNDSLLPEDLIQLIQSYMTGKEAARTSILSKSWYSAWLTRPDLDFDQRDFGRQLFGEHAQDIFWKFVEKTTLRYDESNRLVQSLRLYILYGNYDNCSHAEELIVKAIKLGATDIDFGIDGGLTMFRFGMVLPQEVLGSETLRRLSVRGCMIGLGEDRKARCSGLESLSLKKVVYTDDDIICDIISSCPLIENLSLSDCQFELWRLMPLERLTGSAVDGLISPFNKLKSLFLEKLPIDNSFFHDFGSKFPCLKNLSVHNCDGYRGIRIASTSLECISIVQNRTALRARFDVPCIRKFMYQGTSLPSLSFKDYSRGWKLDISVTVDCLGASWFPRLKSLLAMLSQHEICLSLRILHFTDKSSDNGGDDVQGLPPVPVKDLMLYPEVPSSISSSFLNGLFRSCRPKFITLQLLHCGERDREFLELLCKTLIRELSGNCCIPIPPNLGLDDVDEVDIEVFDEEPAEWRPLPLKTLFEASTSEYYERKIRFLIRWR